MRRWFCHGLENDTLWFCTSRKIKVDTVHAYAKDRKSYLMSFFIFVSLTLLLLFYVIKKGTLIFALLPLVTRFSLNYYYLKFVYWLQKSWVPTPRKEWASPSTIVIYTCLPLCFFCFFEPNRIILYVLQFIFRPG